MGKGTMGRNITADTAARTNMAVMETADAIKRGINSTVS